jgi:atypical dual specificity phosphatase
MLLVEGLRVAFGARPILDSISFALGDVGCTTILGPVAAGKSTLLRTLAGHLEGVHGLTSSGVVARSADLERRPAALVAQSARLLVRTVFENLAAGLRDRSSLSIAEQRDAVRALLACYGLDDVTTHLDAQVVGLPLGTQRLVTIARCLASDPALLLADEPTAGLDEAERRAVVALMRTAARVRHVLCVTHNRIDAMELAGDVLFLVDGRILERSSVTEFFERPRTPEGELFAQTGSCLGLPSATPASATPAEPAPAPAGFHWIREGALAGVSRPGLLADVDRDLRGLVALGIRTLVCLEETRPIQAEQLHAHGLEPIHFPIPDMGAPSVASGMLLCMALHDRLRAGDRIAVHCRAGLGRTGTVLCALLIHEGASALEALDAVRRVQWRFVQSEAQVRFLSDLEARVAELRAHEALERRALEGAKETETRCR